MREENRLPALAAAVVVDGKVIAASAVGVRKFGSPVRVHRDDPFHLGSLVKPMSATMFGVLADHGDLRWDMTMAEMFPMLERTMQPAYRGVTIAQLLSHSGGFPYTPRTREHIAKTAEGLRFEYVRNSVVDPPEASRYEGDLFRRRNRGGQLCRAADKNTL